MAIALSREPHRPQTTTQTQFCCGNIFNCFPFWIVCLSAFLGSALDRNQISKKALEQQMKRPLHWMSWWPGYIIKPLELFCFKYIRKKQIIVKGWGQSAKLKKHSRIWGKFGRAIQGYILNPCTKFPPNPTSRKVNNQELTSQHHA